MNQITKPKAERPIKITAHFVISRHRLGVLGRIYEMEIIYSENCPFCGKVNFVNNGDPGDLSKCDIDGIKCWNCGKEWLFNEDIDIEDAFIEDGLRILTA